MYFSLDLSYFVFELCMQCMACNLHHMLMFDDHDSSAMYLWFLLVIIFGRTILNEIGIQFYQSSCPLCGTLAPIICWCCFQ